MDRYDAPSDWTAPASNWPSWKRGLVRLFVLILPVVIAIDTSPRSIPGVGFLQYHLTPVLRFTGLWQGEWTLFAPNPSINNGWVSAEIYGVPSTNSGDPTTFETRTWNSPYWTRFNSWQKFYRFRHVNYYNRLPFREQATANDFADFVAREMIGPVLTPSRVAPLRRAGEPATAEVELVAAGQKSPDIEVRLFHNNLSIIMPDDGTLPRREEETWMAVSKNLTIRKLQP